MAEDDDSATCPECGALLGEHDPFVCELVSLASVALEASENPAPPLSLPPRPLPARPRGVRLEQEERRTRVTWRHLGARHVGLILLGVICEAAGFALSHGLLGRSRPGLGFFLDVLGLLLLSGALSGLRRTRIEATDERLTVQHTRFGWTREGQSLERQEIVQLYGKAVRGFWGWGRTYWLCALTRRGQRVILASGFTHPRVVLYLERLLEERLGILDGLVKGELAERPPGAGEHYPRVQLTVSIPLDPPSVRPPPPPPE